MSPSVDAAASAEDVALELERRIMSVDYLMRLHPRPAGAVIHDESANLANIRDTLERAVAFLRRPIAAKASALDDALYRLGQDIDFYIRNTAARLNPDWRHTEHGDWIITQLNMLAAFVQEIRDSLPALEARGPDNESPAIKQSDAAIATRLDDLIVSSMDMGHYTRVNDDHDEIMMLLSAASLRLSRRHVFESQGEPPTTELTQVSNSAESEPRVTLEQVEKVLRGELQRAVDLQAIEQLNAHRLLGFIMEKLSPSSSGACSTETK